MGAKDSKRQVLGETGRRTHLVKDGGGRLLRHGQALRGEL